MIFFENAPNYSVFKINKIQVQIALTIIFIVSNRQLLEFCLQSSLCWPSLSISHNRLANKQDKMNALLGNELIEILSLERQVNQSRSLCHIVSTVKQL